MRIIVRQPKYNKKPPRSWRPTAMFPKWNYKTGRPMSKGNVGPF